jgi:hypothetical protein
MGTAKAKAFGAARPATRAATRARPATRARARAVAAPAIRLANAPAGVDSLTVRSHSISKNKTHPTNAPVKRPHTPATFFHTPSLFLNTCLFQTMSFPALGFPKLVLSNLDFSKINKYFFQNMTFSSTLGGGMVVVLCSSRGTVLLMGEVASY